jgi:hypothetical protein
MMVGWVTRGRQWKVRSAVCILYVRARWIVEMPIFLVLVIRSVMD